MDRRDLDTRARLGQKTMNSCRLKWRQGRIIRIDKIIASEILEHPCAGHQSFVLPLSLKNDVQAKGSQ